MKVVITGSHGLIGSNLSDFLSQQGHDITRLVRTRPTGAHEAYWNPEKGEIDANALEGVDAIIHLAGENIAEGRWNQSKKARIKNSRIQGTHLLSETVIGLKKPPSVFICASAIGFYGDRGKSPVDEASMAGSGFLTELCQAWERACLPIQNSGVRLVNMRFGVVLSPQGGALAKMLPPFKMGVAGRVGNGKQYMSWVALDDVLGAMEFALENQKIHGPVNVVAPRAVTNHEFSKTLGHVLHRPAIMPMPAMVARLAFGEMADELLLASTKVRPSRLLAAGYDFQYPELEGALDHLLHA